MTSRLRLALIAASLLAIPSVASAHIQMIKPTPRVPNESGQKTADCGSPGYVRANNPGKTTYFKPGDTVRVMWQETIGHPGWYRVALQPNGETYSYPPAVGNGGFPTVDQTGMTDATTGTMILKDRIPDVGGTTMYMTDVVLPNIECANCTLQLTQFMTDRATYTTGNGGAVYFFCADLVISNNPPPVTPPPATPDAGPVVPDAGVDPGNNDVKGTCSTGSAGGFGAALLVGLLAFVRRRSIRRA